MPRTPRRRSGVHPIDQTFRVWCPQVRHDVRATRCLECPRLSQIMVRGGQRFVACRADRMGPARM
jgi:hypothetical protein